MDKKNIKATKVELNNNDKKLSIDDKLTIKELEEKIESMKEDKEKKCRAAKDQLIEMLEVTVDKYRTATGTAEALRVLRFTVGDGNDAQIVDAVDLAISMAEEALAMRDKAKELAYAKMDQLCDGFYEKEFKVNDGTTNAYNAKNLAFEMMRIDLCRNVGGAAEDMVSFIKRTQEEIDATGEELKKLKAKEN